MGKHLVPRAYLREFTTDRSAGIHVFDLKTGDWRADGRPLSVSKVAQLPGVWPDNIESQLTHIEETGFPVLKRLSNESDIGLSDDDRAAATCYIVSLLGVRSPGVWSYFKPSVLDNLKRAADADDVPDEEERARIDEWFNKERQEVEKGPYRGLGHFRATRHPGFRPGDSTASLRCGGQCSGLRAGSSSQPTRRWGEGILALGFEGGERGCRCPPSVCC